MFYAGIVGRRFVLRYCCLRLERFVLVLIANCEYRRIGSCELCGFGGSASVCRRCTLALIKIVCKFGGWRLRTARTLIDNTGPQTKF